MPALYLDFGLQLSLEATPDDLPLTRLQPIQNRWNRPNIIRHREKNQLLVDELGVRPGYDPNMSQT